jgi:hypothetical protein
VKTRGFFRFERDFIYLKQIPAQKRYRDDVGVFKVVVTLDQTQPRYVTSFSPQSSAKQSSLWQFLSVFLHIPVAPSIFYPSGRPHLVIPEICYRGSRFWYLASYKADPGPEALPG